MHPTRVWCGLWKRSQIVDMVELYELAPKPADVATGW